MQHAGSVAIVGAALAFGDRQCKEVSCFGCTAAVYDR
jgi:hypothetical protein